MQIMLVPNDIACSFLRILGITCWIRPKPDPTTKSKGSYRHTSTHKPAHTYHIIYINIYIYILLENLIYIFYLFLSLRHLLRICIIDLKRISVTRNVGLSMPFFSFFLRKKRSLSGLSVCRFFGGHVFYEFLSMSNIINCQP